MTSQSTSRCLRLPAVAGLPAPRGGLTLACGGSRAANRNVSVPALLRLFRIVAPSHRAAILRPETRPGSPVLSLLPLRRPQASRLYGQGPRNRPRTSCMRGRPLPHSELFFPELRREAFRGILGTVSACGVFHSFPQLVPFGYH